MWWIGTRKGLFAIDDAGAIVGTHFLATPVSMVLADGDLVVVALEHGHYGTKVHRSRDRGQSFEEVAGPAFGQGEPSSPSVQSIWALERGSDDRLWCGTIPGGLFTSDDDGESWQLVRSLWDRPERAEWFGGGADHPGIHSICIHPGDARDVIIGISCGGAWRTRDGGVSWALSAEGMRADFLPPERAGDQNTQDPHRIVRSPTHPDVLWCQHHCGVWRSVDGAASWQPVEVPPSSFGFPVAVHPRDPDTAWFVPAVRDDVRIPVDARVVVARTRDGGTTFDVLRDGLPQEHAYDLVFRHALDVDATGDRLLFGSTTGSVWHSDDGGDHWHIVSRHLPPVYCVRRAN
ncbi:MAG: exo-alpha-sialidase [Myxococcota bacterium]